MIDSNYAQQLCANSMNPFVLELAARFPSQKSITRLFEEMKYDEKESLAFCLQFLQNVYSMDRSEIINCYEVFVNDTLEETKFFFEHGHYRYSTYQEVELFMTSKDDHYMIAYQVGLLLSQFFWPNHNEMRKRFIQLLKNHSGEKYLEVGVGHGFYFKTAIAYSNFQSYTGIDINIDSIEMATQMLNIDFDCTSRNYELVLTDFLKMDVIEKYDAIILSEVLEHVEQPNLFLEKIALLSHKSTWIYVTTAINAPAVDHIYLFRNPDEIYSLFSNCGLTIVDTQLCLYQNKSLDTCLKKLLPVTIMLSAQKSID